MIIAVEPKLIFPDMGVVGIENTFRVGKTGFVQLTLYNEKIIVILN